MNQAITEIFGSATSATNLGYAFLNAGATLGTGVMSYNYFKAGKKSSGALMAAISTLQVATGGMHIWIAEQENPSHPIKHAIESFKTQACNAANCSAPEVLQDQNPNTAKPLAVVAPSRQP